MGSDVVSLNNRHRFVGREQTIIIVCFILPRFIHVTSPAGKFRGRSPHKSIKPQLRNGSGGFVRSRGRRRGQYLLPGQ